MEAGDIVIGVDNMVMDEDTDLSELIRRHEPGGKIALTLLRRGEETEIREIRSNPGQRQRRAG